jgi:dTDP-glucose 4,6-dehydratase
MVKIVVTGGCGFIGYHFIKHIHDITDWTIIIIDMLTYASSGLDRIRSIGLISSPRISLFTYDLSKPLTVGMIKEMGDVDYIVHMAAETHVDNSIRDPPSVIANNITSTVNMLEYARTLKSLKLFFYFSTDEVFGPAPIDTLYKENDTHNPTNPYSASKSAAEQICCSYENTFKIPLIIVNVTNAFGERQHKEKFIPLCIRKVLNEETISIHSYPDLSKSGTRFYIHALDIASAVFFLIKTGTIGEKYNITGEKEISNLDLAQFIARVMDKELKYKMVNFHESRPGHDLRYGLDGSKLKKLGWIHREKFEESLIKTILWEVDNLV